LSVQPIGIERRLLAALHQPGAAQNSQVFVVCGLAAAPFFFCLGFLASRLDRFCSLFATTLSLHVNRRRICCLCAAIQLLNFPPAPQCRFVQRVNAMSSP
jgi:hypothetical protein